jgi:membrane protein
MAEGFSIKTLFTRIGQDDATGLAAEMAYNFMMALVPLLIFLFSLFGLFGPQSGVFDDLMGDLNRIIPPDAFKLIQDSTRAVIMESSGGLAILSFLGALWTSANGAGVIMKALNRAYKCIEDHRPLWKQKLVAIGIVLGIAVIFLVCSNLIVFGGLLINGLTHWFRLATDTVVVLEALRWLVTAVGIIFISMFIYTVGPDFKHHLKDTWPGAVTFVVLWIGISWLFSLYVENMGSYGKVYGPMGAIIILMLWLYLSSLVLLVGGELNALLNGCSKTDGEPKVK